MMCSSWQKGPKCATTFAAALHETHHYFHDIGANLSISKSFNFASSTADRQWLSTTMWPVIQNTIKVLSSFRYLGAHIKVNGGGAQTPPSMVGSLKPKRC